MKEILLALMEALVQKKKIYKLILVKQKQRFANDDYTYLFVNGKEIYKFQAGNKNFPSQFS